jgi:hypothetical protein
VGSVCFLFMCIICVFIWCSVSGCFCSFQFIMWKLTILDFLCVIIRACLIRLMGGFIAGLLALVVCD